MLLSINDETSSFWFYHFESYEKIRGVIFAKIENRVDCKCYRFYFIFRWFYLVHPLISKLYRVNNNCKTLDTVFCSHFLTAL